MRVPRSISLLTSIFPFINVDKMADDREAQPRAGLRPGSIERLEQAGLIVRRNPASGIGHLQQPMLGVRSRDLYRTRAVLGELDGVADQVEQDLPQVAPDRRSSMTALRDADRS